MVCKITSTENRPARHTRGGFTLMELLFASLLTGLVVFTLVGMSISSGRHFAAYANYVDLNDANRLTMDMITRDVREANKVYSAGTNFLYLDGAGGQPILYYHTGSTKTVRRWVNGTSKVVLSGCDWVHFSLHQRNPLPGTYDLVPTSDATVAKAIDVAWNCSRTILGVKANTESVQTARVVIRKQGT